MNALAEGAEDLDSSGYCVHQYVPEERIPVIESVRYGYEKKAAYLGEWKLLVSRGDGTAIGFPLPEEEPPALSEEAESSLQEALPSCLMARETSRLSQVMQNIG